MADEIPCIPIDKNIPIPPRNFNGGYSNLAKLMKKGDSVKVKTYSQAITIQTTIRNMGGRATLRKMNGYMRVWRTE